MDIAVLESLVGPDREVINEVLQDFLQSATCMGRELIEASANADASQAAAVAHKLKSSARSVGALRLAEVCARIESADVSGDGVACQVLMPQFEAELAAVRSYLQEQLSADRDVQRYA
jgi:two-component system sensor histidine kinase/response regulator